MIPVSNLVNDLAVYGNVNINFIVTVVWIKYTSFVSHLYIISVCIVIISFIPHCLISLCRENAIVVVTLYERIVYLLPVGLTLENN